MAEDEAKRQNVKEIAVEDREYYKLGGTPYALQAASMIHPTQAGKGAENQDAYDFIGGEDYLAFAVADGAGSLKHSKLGAEVAVEVAVGMTVDTLLQQRKADSEEELNLRNVLAEAVLEAQATIHTLPEWKEAGSTLVAGVLTPEGFALAAVGDSFAVLQNTNGELELLQPPSVGEFANITELLTSANPTVSFVTGSRDRLSAIALCSDAFEHSTLEQRVPTRGFWLEVLRQAQQQSLESLKLIEFMRELGRIDDDATLLTIATVEEGLESTGEEAEVVNFTYENCKLQDLREELEFESVRAKPKTKEQQDLGKPQQGLPRYI